MIRLIEIELFSFCNRSCRFCLNSKPERINKSRRLSEQCREAIISYLRETDYDGYISLSRFNEPLAEPGALKEFVGMVKNAAKDCTVVSNTNGDFLDPNLLPNLGIDELSIMDYDRIGEKACAERLEQLGVDFISIEYPYITGKLGNTEIIYFVDFLKNHKIGNRGGILDAVIEERRSSFCAEPSKFVGIDYNGNVMPCCEFHSDFKQHKKYVLGDLNTSSMKQILESDERKRILRGAGGFESCMNCQKIEGRYTKKTPSLRPN